MTRLTTTRWPLLSRTTPGSAPVWMSMTPPLPLTTLCSSLQKFEKISKIYIKMQKKIKTYESLSTMETIWAVPTVSMM